MELLPYLIVIPLSSAFLSLLFGRRFKGTSETITVVASLALAALSIKIAKIVLVSKVIVFKVGNWMPPFGIPMVVDSLAAFMLIIANIVALIVAVYSLGYVKVYSDRWKYYTLFAVMVAGVNGVLLSGDIFNLFVYLEIASITAYALVAYGLEDEALEASFKYAVMSSVASCFILLGIACLYSFTSTLNMADMAPMLASHRSDSMLILITALFVMGFGLKSGLVPFHAWLPDAYTRAPATLPAMSSGVLLKTLGVYAICRLFFNVIGISHFVLNVFILFGLLSMVVGAVLAFGQKRLRRLLGYSSIGQVGYIFLALGVGTPLAILAALLHIFNHSAAKVLLFLKSGAVEDAEGNVDTQRIAGLMSKRPIAGWAGLTGAMSVCGIPPFGGFWSKALIIFACVQAGRPILALVAAIVSMLTLAYYFKAFSPMVFSSEGNITGQGLPAMRKVHLSMNLAMIVFIIVVSLGGLVLIPGPARDLIDGASLVLSRGSDYGNVVFGAFK